jgi:hypothetical protein
MAGGTLGFLAVQTFETLNSLASLEKELSGMSPAECLLSKTKMLTGE